MSVKKIRFKLVDELGRTVCRFGKSTHFDAGMQPEKTELWGAESKPLSEKWLEGDNAGPSRDARLAGTPVRCTDDGRVYLELPGLTLRWGKVTSVLDRIAVALQLVDAAGVVLVDDMDAATLTTDQLRKYVGS